MNGAIEDFRQFGSILGTVSRKNREVNSFKVQDCLADFNNRKKILVDEQPFDLIRYSYLDYIYRDVLTRENLTQPEFRLVLQCGAQTGKTVIMSTLMLYLALMLPGSSWGYYFPTQLLAQIYSNMRFAKLVNSNQAVANMAMSDAVMDRIQNAYVRQIGMSNLYFLWTSGTMTTESLPLTGVFFDEVRKMNAGDIERAQERLSASPTKIDIKVSTAGFPDSDINAYFNDSTQHYFHTECPKCKRRDIILSEAFPRCIKKVGRKRTYVCPSCDKVLAEPTRGKWVSHNPGSRTWGFSLPQMLSPNISAEQIWHKWTHNRDRSEFYKSVLGKPHIDKDVQPVNETVFNSCVNEKLKWGLAERVGEYNYMGVDQRGGENHVVIARREPKKKLQIVHLEIVQDDDPFARLYQLFAEFNIACCVLDQNPNFNEAVKFAKHYERRVFCCTYHDTDTILSWGDKRKRQEAKRKTKPEHRFDYTVRADRYKTIDIALRLWSDKKVEIPPPGDFHQPVWSNGREVMSPLATGNPESKDAGLLLHLMSVARVQVPVHEKGPDGNQIETGRFRMVWQNLRGIDPHFLHAWNYAIMASERRLSAGRVYLAGEASTEVESQQESLKNQAIMAAGGRPGDGIKARTKCLACEHYNAEPPRHGHSCELHRIQTEASMPICNQGFRAKRENAKKVTNQIF